MTQGMSTEGAVALSIIPQDKANKKGILNNQKELNNATVIDSKTIGKTSRQNTGSPCFLNVTCVPALNNRIPKHIILILFPRKGL